MKWGILATGNIAGKFASTIRQMEGEGQTLAAVGSRRAESAAAFGRVCAGAFAALKPISLGGCLFYMAISVDSGHSTASYRYRGSITPRAHLLEKVGSRCKHTK